MCWPSAIAFRLYRTNFSIFPHHVITSWAMKRARFRRSFSACCFRTSTRDTTSILDFFARLANFLLCNTFQRRSFWNSLASQVISWSRKSRCVLFLLGSGRGA